MTAHAPQPMWIPLTFGEVTLGLDAIQAGQILEGQPEFGPEWLKDTPIRTRRIGAVELTAEPVTTREFCIFLNEIGNNATAGVPWYWDCSPYSFITRESGRYAPISGCERYPVSGVSVAGARAYASWVGARLPTECEWEAAARAGSNGVWPRDALGRKQLFNHFDLPVSATAGWMIPLNDGRGPTPASLFPPNAWGFHDMLGNVWEWCEPDSTIFDDQPVLKGGSWNDIAMLAFLPAFRHPCPADYPTTYTFGFRLARNLVAGSRSENRDVAQKQESSFEWARMTESRNRSCEDPRLRRVRESRALLMELIFAHGEDALRWCPGPPLWSSSQIVVHLAEAEAHFMTETCIAAGFGPERFGATTPHCLDSQDIDAVCGCLTAVREQTVRALLAIAEDPPCWGNRLRRTSHPLLIGRTIGEAIDFMVFHEVRHINQIDGILRQYQQAGLS